MKTRTHLLTGTAATILDSLSTARATVPTVTAALAVATRALEGCSDSPRLDAELLLGQVLGLSRSGLIVRGTDTLAPDCLRVYEALIGRRSHGIPVAYLTGRREFWSLSLRVTPAVLVPRPETEVLVERTLALLPDDAARSVLDLGTGSGAIALAIASERPHAHITGVDISEEALDVARANASLVRQGARIRWRLGAWFDAVLGERFDLIVANPPYIAAGDPALAALGAEPALALAAGPTGLEALTAIVEAAPLHLNPRGWLLLEHGSIQASAVASMLERRGFTGIRTDVDYSGNPRITLGTLHSAH